MKRTLFCTALLVLCGLLLAGCELLEDAPQETLPVGSYVLAVTSPLQPSGEKTEPEQSEQTVKRVINYEGEIPYSYPVKLYRYQLPFIDLPDQYAMICNQEIESLFGARIRSSMQAMESGQGPELEAVTYLSFICGEILTLRIDERSFDEKTTQTYYTLNARTGAEVSARELFAEAGINGEPEQVCNQTVTELFARRFGPPEEGNEAYTTALTRTQMGLVPLTTKWMHLTEAGQLILALTLYHPTGGMTYEEIPLP